MGASQKLTVTPHIGFTPKLAEFYKAFQASRKDDFEIVFISSDKDQVSGVIFLPPSTFRPPSLLDLHPPSGIV